MNSTVSYRIVHTYERENIIAITQIQRLNGTSSGSKSCVRIGQNSINQSFSHLIISLYLVYLICKYGWRLGHEFYRLRIVSYIQKGAGVGILIMIIACKHTRIIPRKVNGRGKDILSLL